MGWWIALGVIVALGFLPLGISLRYDDSGFRLGLLAGLIKIPLSGAKKKKKKSPKTKGKPKTSKNGSGNSHQKKTPKKGGALSDFLPLIDLVIDFLQAFRRKLRIRRLEMKLIMAGDDPCDLAVNYGRAQAALGALIPQLERCFVIQKRNLEVECDFESTETLIRARIELTITLGRLLRLLIRYGLRILKHFINQKNSNKGGNSK